jgi:peptide/nickel transport system substrate-binding protein
MDVYLSHATRALSPVNPASWLYDIHLPTFGYDPAKARAAIRFIRQDGTPLRILVGEENTERKKIAEGFAKSLLEIGLLTELTVLPFDEFNERIETGDYDIFVGCFYLDVVPDLTFAFHSDGNIFNYADPELDALLAAAASAYSESEHVRLMHAVQQYIADALPVISLAFRHSAVLTDTRVTGALEPALWYSLSGVNGWGLE